MTLGLGRRSLVAFALCASLTGCTSAPPRTAPRYVEPTWRDVLVPTPDLLLILRPRELRDDVVYGPLLRRVIQLARERGDAVAAARTLDAVEDADEVLFGVQDSDRGRRGGDLVFVACGVRADLDPSRLVDESGHPLWMPGPSGPIRELVPTGAASASGGASLFELPGRTWLVATGERLALAHAAFESGQPRAPAASPETAAAGDLEGDSLVVARVNGPSLVGHVRALQPPAELAAIGRSLTEATLALLPGAQAVVRATLTYSDDGAVAQAQATIRRALDAVAAWKPEEYAWLRVATVEGAPHRVVVRAPLPKEVLSALALTGSPATRGNGTSGRGPSR